MPVNDFGAWLQWQLDRREWTQSDFARKAGVSTGLVSNWIGGARRPTPASVDKIADALMLDVDEVLTRAGHRPALPTDAIDALHARIDPYLRRLAGRPGMDDRIVNGVRNLVELLEDVSPPRSPGDAGAAGESPSESGATPGARSDR